MINEESWKEIANIFIGDTEGFYLYKSGPVLVSFFNERLGYKDQYGQGLPSRWAYVVKRFEGLVSENAINRFFSSTLSSPFIMQDLQGTEGEALEAAEKVKGEYSRILRINGYMLVGRGSEYQLIKINTDLEKIGEGGFAEVFKQHSTDLRLRNCKRLCHRKRNQKPLSKRIQHHEIASGSSWCIGGVRF